jgi:hypothetical protein
VTILVNAYSTLVAKVELGFDHDLIGQRDRSDPELVDHLHGFIGYVLDGGNRDMSASLYAVIQHIQRVQNHYSFEIEEDALEALSAWGWKSNSIFFLPDSSVRDPAGAVLIDAKTGEPAEEAQIPFPPDARQRKLQSEVNLRNRGIDTPELLPPIISEQEVVLRNADDVAWRALALFILAVRAESLGSQRPIPIDQLRSKSPMAFKAFTDVELAFMNNESPDQQQVAEMAWRYECLNVLQWVLGFQEELKFPDEICDVPLVAQTMVDRDDRQIINMARLLPVSQILDAADQNQRLLWAARQARLEETDPPAGLDGGVLVERQHAFNWLIRFQDAGWDDVDTPS